jgi:hypothetical protein
MMPSVFSVILSVVASTTAARADTPFFWDDFHRDVLEDTEVQWEAVASYLEDGNLLVDPADHEGGGGVRTFLAPLSDFSIRTQVNFEGTEYYGPEPWLGVWSSDQSFLDPDGRHYWGGINTNGFSSVGANFYQVNPSTPCGCSFDSAFNATETYDRDINLQFDAIGDKIELFAWYDGTEKPTEPQTTVDDRTQFDSTVFGITLNRTNVATGDIIPDQRAFVRYYAVLPAVTGDFSASDTLDLEDINLIDQELRGESKNRVFDLTEDGLVTREDRQMLIKDVIRTWYGDSNLDGEFNTADLVTVFQAGEYEDGLAQNSSWSTGDWTGDADFDTSDLVLAFQDGGFEQGLVAAVNAVPEPCAGMLLAIGSMCLLTSTRRHRYR